ncbi:hypothetical protein IWW36_004397, partial [Coemansia brasiliensis]
GEHHGSGIIYTKASDFVHPKQPLKGDISCPIKSRPMGSVDVTANDFVCSGAAPSSREVHLLEKHLRQTAHALKTSRRRVLHQSQQTD